MLILAFILFNLFISGLVSGTGSVLTKFTDDANLGSTAKCGRKPDYYARRVSLGLPRWQPASG